MFRSIRFRHFSYMFIYGLIYCLYFALVDGWAYLWRGEGIIRGEMNFDANLFVSIFFEIEGGGGQKLVRSIIGVRLLF